MEEVKLEISGMHCAGCASSLVRVLNTISGVNNAQVKNTSATIKTDDKTPELVKQIISRIVQLGYQAELV